MGAILLVPLPGADSLNLEHLRTELEITLQRPVELADAVRNADAAYDPSRDQYNSRKLLDLLRALAVPPSDRVLGVTSLDLFIPVLTFVFGEAQLLGPAAVVSFFRLDNRFYGLPADKGLLKQRLVKEAVHELGHTYGLRHCPDLTCVMRSSTYVEMIDLKTKSFCMGCMRMLSSDTGSS
jgi:archaemetzincin